MKTKDELWAEITAAEPALAAQTPAVGAVAPRTIQLERELNANTAFFVTHLRQAVDKLPANKRTGWLTGLLSGDPGYVFEAYAFGAFAGRDYTFDPLVTVPSADLFRLAGGGPVELDGQFTGDIYFDIKSLSRPSGVLEELLDAINEQINPNGRRVLVSGALDFDHKELGQHFTPVVNGVVAAAAGASFKHPDFESTFRFYDTGGPAPAVEGTFNPYRFAAENRRLVVTHTKQVHRTARFMLVYVYSQLDHELATFPDLSELGERALARRVFVELVKDTDPATRYSPKADGAVTVLQVAKAIGGLCFVCVRQGAGEIDIRFYLNPNANPQQRITEGHIEAVTDFANDVYIEDFECDNY